MDGVSIFFLVVMILVGGFVAYTGDLLGRRLGKKRLKFGRLRPKHTAALGTFIAGVLGTLVTILVLATVSEPVRVWLVQGENARRDLIAAKEELASVRSERDSARTNVDTLRTQTSQMAAELEASGVKLSEQQAAAASAQTRAQELQTRANNLESTVARYEKDLVDTRKRLDELNKQRDALQIEIDRNQALLASSTRDNQALQSENYRLTSVNADLEEAIAEANTESLRLSSEISRYERELETTKEELRTVNETYGRQIEAANRDLSRVQRDLADLEGKRSTLQWQVSQLERLTDRSRYNPLVYNLFDELARIQVRDRLTFLEAEVIINDILKAADQDAKERGASPAAFGEYVSLVNDQRLTTVEQRQVAAQALAGKPHQQIILAVTRMNTFEGEPVPISLEVFPNKVVYEQGDTVLEITVDGRKSQDDILEAVLNELSTRLSTKAINDGMLPAKGRANPLGEVTREMVLDMVESVRAARANVRLRLIATKETRAGDRLDLAYQVVAP